jgi:hypothetical protein
VEGVEALPLNWVECEIFMHFPLDKKFARCEL